MVERIALVLLGAVILESLGNLALHRWQDRELVSAAQTGRIAEQLVDATRIASAAPIDERAILLSRLDIDRLALNWVPRTVLTDLSASHPRLSSLRQRLVAQAPALAKRDIRLNLLPAEGEEDRDLIGTVKLDDGSFVSFRVTGYLDGPPSLATILVLHALLIALVFGVALVMIGALVRPLLDLARAADATGRDHVARIVPAGPHEVRRVATAFAAMQARLLRIMEDNTQALIAVSHDLRTPIQRLRLRAGLLRADEDREAITQDLEEMEHFIDATLAYVRSGLDETPRLIDLSALISTVVDDAGDTGIDARFTGPGSLLLSARPNALKRMLYNLIDNSRRYADQIRIGLSEDGRGGVEIVVEDNGPGIPPELHAKALQPFTRLDPPGRRTGRMKGGGLGLAFVRRTVEAHDGALALEDGTMGGLLVRIHLPAAQPADLAGK